MDASTITTYKAGMLQAQAHRSLNVMKNNILKPYGISIMQWVVLGAVYDAGSAGIRTSDLAQKLSTTLAFITNTVNLLEAKEFVYKTANTEDSRSKLIKFELKRSEMFLQIEQEVRKRLRETVYSKITREELNTYLSVITKFAA